MKIRIPKLINNLIASKRAQLSKTCTSTLLDNSQYIHRNTSGNTHKQGNNKMVRISIAFCEISCRYNPFEARSSGHARLNALSTLRKAHQSPKYLLLYLVVARSFGIRFLHASKPYDKTHHMGAFNADLAGNIINN